MSEKNNLSWFRFLRPTLTALTSALRADSISANDLVVYLVLRSEAALSEQGFKQGEVSLRINEISSITGFSRSTVKRCLSKLDEEGYLTRRSLQGQTGKYVMRDIAVLNADGEKKSAQWDYVPRDETQLLRDLTAFDRGEKEDLPLGVQVQNLQINLTVNNFYGSEGAERHTGVPEPILKLIEDPLTDPRIKKILSKKYPHLTHDSGHL